MHPRCAEPDPPPDLLEHRIKHRHFVSIPPPSRFIPPPSRFIPPAPVPFPAEAFALRETMSRQSPPLRFFFFSAL